MNIFNKLISIGFVFLYFEKWMERRKGRKSFLFSKHKKNGGDKKIFGLKDSFYVCQMC